MRFSNLGANAVLVTAAALTLVNAGLMTTSLTGFAHITEQLGSTLVAGPKGDTGETGAAGPQGEPGPRGATGLTGPMGPAGASGDQGAAGANGSDGVDGQDGANGQDGAAGAQGPVGDQGPIGEQGIQGIQGPIGLTGPQGPTGVVSATAPLIYDAETQTLSLNLDQIDRLGALGYLQFDTSVDAPEAPGRITWNDADGTANLQLKDGAVTLQIGQESVQLVKNITGSTLLNGRAVRVTGSSGGRITVEHADNNSVTGATGVIGVLTEDVLTGENGYVTTYGLVHELDTSQWSPGAPLYLNGTGQLTNVRPTNGRIVQLGFVVTQDSSQGVIYVAPIQNFEPIIGGICQVPGQAGTGVYGWHNLAGSRWIVVCDYP
ncbi:MAG: hypothetical protein RL716_117 [Actinomycetota bacterium]|uniref:hypothetical protein n=1 Tax=Rhodoluna sp. TaxID=1969481 RepID=UPI0025DE7B79|nr:hypothetical protein [Rhodoluna sp.]